MTADPLSAQVHSKAQAWGVLPKHLNAPNIVARAVSELELIDAQLHHAADLASSTTGASLRVEGGIATGSGEQQIGTLIGANHIITFNGRPRFSLSMG